MSIPTHRRGTAMCKCTKCGLWDAKSLRVDGGYTPCLCGARMVRISVREERRDMKAAAELAEQR